MGFAHSTSQSTTTNHNTNTPNSSAQAWVVCLIASLFFLYEFTQMNFIDSISPPLIAAFHISSTQLGFLGSAYLISNVLFLLPAGMILDKFSTKRVILTMLGLCIAGTTALSLSTSFDMALAARFFTGIGGAFCLVSCLRLATHWFPPHKMAKVTSIIIFIAMLGGMLSQTPVAILSKHMQWQHILRIDAILGIFFWLLIAKFVRDTPVGMEKVLDVEHKEIEQMGMFKGLLLVLSRKDTWLAGLYTSFMNLPLSLFGITWGVLLLSATHHISDVTASEMTTMMFIGTIIGSPLVGWISEKWHTYRLPMATGAICSLVLILILLYAGPLSTYTVGLLCLLIGFTTSTQVLGYPMITETSPKAVTAMSLSLGSLLIMGSQAAAQPFFGYLIDHHGHRLNNVYHASEFSTAIIIFPVVILIALFLVLLMPKIKNKTN